MLVPEFVFLEVQNTFEPMSASFRLPRVPLGMDWGAACVFLGALGCSSEACDTAQHAGIMVTVAGGGSPSPPLAGAAGAPGSEECAAAVEIEPKRGGREAALSCSTSTNPTSGEQDCVCAGVDQGGIYTVTATLNGETEEVDVTIEGSGCHIETEDVCFFGPC